MHRDEGVRCGHGVSGGCACVIDETPRSYDGDKLVLTLPKAYADMDGERLRRRFDALAQLMDRTGEIRLAR